MKEYKRSERVGDLIQREVSLMLLRDIKDPRVEMVSVTGVKVGDDLRHATLFFSVMGDAKRWDEAAKGLASSKGFIRRELGRRLKMKYIPDIHFKEDRSLEQGERIDRILSQLDVKDE